LFFLQHYTAKKNFNSGIIAGALLPGIDSQTVTTKEKNVFYIRSQIVAELHQRNNAHKCYINPTFSMEKKLVDFSF